MLPNQYGRKQFWLEVAGILALGGVLLSFVIALSVSAHGNTGWGMVGYMLGMTSMLVLVIYFACSRSWHDDMQRSIDQREKKKV